MTVMPVPSPSVPWQTNFLAVLPAVQTHAQIQFRRLRSDRREEAIQEAIASACISYQLLAAQGQLEVAHPGTLADYAVKFVRNGRHVGGHQDRPRDVMSPVARKRHGVRVLSFQARPSGGGCESWKTLVVADRKARIPDLAAFRLDFEQFLKRMTYRDRRIVIALAGGEGTGAVAGRFGLSPARVSQLRRSYEHRWQVFQGEVTVGAQAC